MCMFWIICSLTSISFWYISVYSHPLLGTLRPLNYRTMNLWTRWSCVVACFQNANSLTIFKDFVVQGQRLKARGQGFVVSGQGQAFEEGQGLVVRGQGLVNWSLRILDDKDFPRGQQHCSVHTSRVYFVPSSRLCLSYYDCLEDKREDYQNCSVLYCVPQLYSVIFTLIWAVLTGWFRISCFLHVFGFLTHMVSYLVFLCIIWFLLGCQYQRNRLPGKTHPQNFHKIIVLSYPAFSRNSE